MVSRAPAACGLRTPISNSNYTQKKIMINTLRNHLAIIAIAMAGSAFGASNADEPLTKEIHVTGEVELALVITVDSLKQMNVFEGGNHQLLCRSGENRKKINSFKGVLLKDILQKSHVKIPHPKEGGRYVVLITSTNDYKASYVYNELMFNETGNNVYVTFEENGAPITQGGGLMSVVTLNDNMTGVRHVKWPAKIEVIKLN